MDYDHIVFVGWVLDTAPKRKPDGSKEYLGLADPAHDIEARCELVAGAMAKAKSMVPHRARTLYVFVAPEFLFRGKTGAYTMDALQLAI
jgi:hypothetical protein